MVVGLIAAPGPCAELAEALLPDLAERIAVRIPGVRWEVRYVTDRLVEWPADLSSLMSAAHRRALAEGWQLAVCLTDLPLQTARRPVVAHASMTHGVAVLSLPALGAVAVVRRASETVVPHVATLLGDGDGDGDGDRDGDGDGDRDRRAKESGNRRAKEPGNRRAK
ncbi:MAG: hypothetical protein JWP76_6094, partial [Dactylosporangium sp.]|nr:hypothetical protein [Dactylosporangium sp.]